jgi:hypothetical protein
MPHYIETDPDNDELADAQEDQDAVYGDDGRA